MIPFRILNAETENYSSRAAAILSECGEVWSGPYSRTELINIIPDFDVLIVRLGHNINREVLEKAARLKAIVTATTGLDHIDVGFAMSKGIEVLSLKGEIEFLRSIPATAELTWGLILALQRNIPAAAGSVLRGSWDRDLYRGHDLSGKVLGILGLGRIGEKVAAFGLAFGMHVIAHDPYRRDWLPHIERIDKMDELLQRSQLLSIHVPLNPDTQLLIGERELALLPKGAYLINTSRGQIIDEGALISALESGHLAGAALDVIWNENEIALDQSPLVQYGRRHHNLLLTPHIGGATVESMAATEVFMANKLKHFLEKIGH